MITVEQLNILYRTECLVLKIRIILKAEKIFLFSNIQPYAKRGNIFKRLLKCPCHALVISFSLNIVELILLIFNTSYDIFAI